MRFDEFNKNDKGERLDLIINENPLALLPALARGAASAAAPVIRKGGQELIKRGKPVIQNLIKKGKDAFKRDPKDAPQFKGKSQGPAGDKSHLRTRNTGPNARPNAPQASAPSQPAPPSSIASPKPPASATAPRPGTQPPALATPKPGTAPKIRTQPPKPRVSNPQVTNPGATAAPKQPTTPAPSTAAPKPPASTTAPRPGTQPPPRVAQPKPGSTVPKPQQAPKPQARTNPKQAPKPKQAPGVKSRTGTGTLPKKSGGIGKGIGLGGLGVGALGLAGLAALAGRGGAGGNPYGKEPDEFNTDNLPQGATGTQMATPAKGIVPGPGPKQAQAAADQPGADPTDPKAQAQQRKMQKMQKDVAQKQIKAKKAEAFLPDSESPGLSYFDFNGRTPSCALAQ